MNCIRTSQTDVALLDLLQNLDEARNHYDRNVATGDHPAASWWLKRMTELAKEVDELIVTDEPSKVDA